MMVYQYLTVIIMPSEVVFVYEEVVVSVQLPEFTVDHVEMLITGT